MLESEQPRSESGKKAIWRRTVVCLFCLIVSIKMSFFSIYFDHPATSATWGTDIDLPEGMTMFDSVRIIEKRVK